MEPKGLFLYSQDFATGPNLEPDQGNSKVLHSIYFRSGYLCIDTNETHNIN
jgi:hypothetical protein